MQWIQNRKCSTSHIMNTSRTNIVKLTVYQKKKAIYLIYFALIDFPNFYEKLSSCKGIDKAGTYSSCA